MYLFKPSTYIKECSKTRYFQIAAQIKRKNEINAEKFKNNG